LRISLAVSPLSYDKLAVEVVELDDIARVFVVPCGSARGIGSVPEGSPSAGLRAFERSPIENNPLPSFRSAAMTPRRYGRLAYVPIHRRLPLTWPNGAHVALWVNPNVEFFSLDDVMPSNLNDRVPREEAKIPNVRNWAVRDYGNRVGIWRLMEVLTRYGIRASAAR
jgi:hypothetical protein